MAAAAAAAAAADSKSPNYEKVQEEVVPMVKAAASTDTDNPLALGPSVAARQNLTTDCGDSCCARMCGCYTTAAYDAAWAKRDADRSLEIKNGVLYYTSHLISVNPKDDNCTPFWRWMCCGCKCGGCGCCALPRVSRYFKAIDLNTIKTVRGSFDYDDSVSICTTDSTGALIIADVKDPAKCVDYIRSEVLKARGATVAAAEVYIAKATAETAAAAAAAATAMQRA